VADDFALTKAGSGYLSRLRLGQVFDVVEIESDLANLRDLLLDFCRDCFIVLLCLSVSFERGEKVMALHLPGLKSPKRKVCVDDTPSTMEVDLAYL
jgi:hypothetical protein